MKCDVLPDHHKYTYEIGQRQHLFNAQSLRSAERAWIVEGELDAMSIVSAVDEVAFGDPTVGAVGYPGVDSWFAMEENAFVNVHWPVAFENCSQITVVGDGDDVGKQAAKDVAKSLRDTVSGEIRTRHFPDGEDANSVLVSEGPEELLEMIGYFE